MFTPLTPLTLLATLMSQGINIRLVDFDVEITNWKGSDHRITESALRVIVDTQIACRY